MRWEAHAATQAAHLIDHALQCERRLDAEPRRKRLRSEWERCIKRFAKLTEKHPQDPLAETALYRQVTLTRGLAHYSGSPRDARDADTLFARYQSLYPKVGNRRDPRIRTVSPITIVIDPGHGGKDPGTTGLLGVTEKDVVLDVANRLKHLLSTRSGITVLLTRNQDEFLSLEDRTRFAADQQADLFVSIHANASPQRQTKGAEVYVLGHSTDAAAVATAERENRSLGQPRSNMNAVIQLILTDLSTTTQVEQSLELAHSVHQSVVTRVGSQYPLVDLGIKRAPFYVLLNTSMPSILYELSFVSNPEEARRLKSSAFRQRMADALARGITDYVGSELMARAVR